MNLDTERFTTEIPNALAATGEDYTVTIADLGEYGTSYEITKSGSDRKMCLTPIDGDLIDMALYEGTGNTIANGTLFNKAVADITPEDLAKLVTICL